MVSIEANKIRTPYNAGFVSELKRRVPSARWRAPYWVFKPDARPVVEEIAEKFFPPEHKKRRYRLHFYNLDDYESPSLNGNQIVDFGRNNYRFRHPDVIEVVDAKLRTSGSRRNPLLKGEFVVVVKATPDAVEEMVSEWSEKVQVEDLDIQDLPKTRELAGMILWDSGDTLKPLHCAPVSSPAFAAMLLAEAEKLEQLAAAYRQRAEGMANDEATEGIRKVEVPENA